MNPNNNISYNSEIEILELDGRKYIDKRLRLPIPSHAAAEEVRQQVLLQRQAFEKMHVPISELVNIEVIRDAAGEEERFSIYMREVFAGLDFMDVVSDDNYNMYLDRLLQDVFEPLLRSTSKELLSAGIDPVLRNFVYNHKRGEFCYVDFMPPKVHYKGHYTQEIPELPAGEFYNVRLLSHNNRAGVIYNLYVNLLREFPRQLGFTAARLEQFLNNIAEPDLYALVSSSPLYRQHSPAEVLKTVEGLQNWHGANYLLLREAANWLHNYNPELGDLKRDIYKATSQERDPKSPEYGTLRADNFAQALSLIKQGLAQCI
jgi:hypothetical protein